MPFPNTHPALAAALAARGYDEPTSVQAAVLAAESGGRDLLVSAQTGSGKTVAFGLAMAETLLGENARFSKAERPMALIIAPTRELALQVHRELEWLYEGASAQLASCVGGMDMRREQRNLAAGAHIVVGTPGRLRDHMERGSLDISEVSLIVLDEADEMLDLGFRDDLEFMLDAAPPSRRTLMFSATIAKDIASLAKRYQRETLRIDTIVANQPHADIEYQAIRIAPNDAEHAIVNLLRFQDSGAALVFCATREAVKALHRKLVERGFAAVALSGELSQNDRTHALQSLRDGHARVCVATDVAARGLDLPDLGLVIHADLPTNAETLLHRSGRTGRAGKKGLCALLVPYTKRRQAERIIQTARVNAEWMTPPTPDQVRAKDRERLLQHAIFDAENADEDLALAQALIAGRRPEEIAAALARLYRAQLPAPEELFDVGADQPRRERAPRDARDDAGPMIWFRMNAGHFNNANPRWLIPLICRLGHVTKADIGAIRIFERDTRFEIVAPAAQRFMTAVRHANDPEVRIEEVRAAHPRAPAPAPAPAKRAKKAGPPAFKKKRQRPGG